MSRQDLDALDVRSPVSEALPTAFSMPTYLAELCAVPELDEKFERDAAEHRERVRNDAKGWGL